MSDTEDFVRADVQAFLDMLKALNRPQLHEIPLEEARAASKTLVQMADLAPHDVAVVRDLACPGPGGDIPLRLYDPEPGAGARPVVMFFHGGGFVVGSVEGYHSLCTAIAAGTGLPVVSVEYRLAPEHPFPAAPDDCEAAARWVASAPEELGLEVSGLVTMGDSAGGNMTIVTTQALVDRPAELPVVLQVPLYPIAGPVTEHESFKRFSEGFFLTFDTMGWFTRAYAADEGDVRNYPLLAEDHSRTPPTVLMTAGLDPLRDSGREYAAHLIQAGVDVSYFEARGSIHGFANMRKAIPSAAKDLETLLAAVSTHLERLG